MNKHMSYAAGAVALALASMPAARAGNRHHGIGRLLVG